MKINCKSHNLFNFRNCASGPIYADACTAIRVLAQNCWIDLSCFTHSWDDLKALVWVDCRQISMSKAFIHWFSSKFYFARLSTKNTNDFLSLDCNCAYVLWDQFCSIYAANTIPLRFTLSQRNQHIQILFREFFQSSSKLYHARRCQ